MAARLIVAGMADDVGMSEVDKKAEVAAKILREADVAAKLLREAEVAKRVSNKAVAQGGRDT